MVQAVVVLGGGALSTRALEAIRDDAVIIAADSGLDHAVEAGLRPTVLVGDLDSISASGRMWAYAREVEIHEHPADKDATDTEIAIERALQVPDARQLLVIGGLDAAGERRLLWISAHPLRQIRRRPREGAFSFLASSAPQAVISIRLPSGSSTTLS